MRIPIDRPPAWMDRGLCTSGEIDPETFFPGKGRAFDKAAKQVCASCPVTAECLDYALGQGTRLYGVWGGTTETDRRAIHRARRKTA